MPLALRRSKLPTPYAARVHTTRRMAALVVSGLLVAACTGERPRLGAVVDASGSAAPKTGDQTVDAMVHGLEHHESAVFSATYRVERRFGAKVSTATVVVDRGRTSITIGDVLIVRGATEHTCSIRKKTCETGVLEARLSDAGVTSHFFDTSPARRLRVAMTRRTGATTMSADTVAGVAVTCVAVPIVVATAATATTVQGTGTTVLGTPGSLTAGTERYCTTVQGLLGVWDGADVSVQLTMLSSTIDENAFKLPT